MAINNMNNKRGFTIIEVVLVLAIAGLIFLMVFIALPSLQRSQRDTQRRNDYSALSANMTQYMTNNNGSLPGNGYLDSKQYINSTGNDPNGYYYSLRVSGCGTTSVGEACTVAAPVAVATEVAAVTSGAGKHDAIPVGASQVYIVKNASCDNGTPKYNSSSRAFAIYGYLETGNGTYCQSNN